jgi:hypothetical protein
VVERAVEVGVVGAAVDVVGTVFVVAAAVVVGMERLRGDYFVEGRSWGNNDLEIQLEHTVMKTVAGMHKKYCRPRH